MLVSEYLEKQITLWTWLRWWWQLYEIMEIRNIGYTEKS